MRYLAVVQIIVLLRWTQSLQRDFKAVEATYGDTVLHRTIAKTYVGKLLKNARIVRFLSGKSIWGNSNESWLPNRCNRAAEVSSDEVRGRCRGKRTLAELRAGGALKVRDGLHFLPFFGGEVGGARHQW